MTTEGAWREYRRESKKNIEQRDRARANADRVTAAEFARKHSLNPRMLRRHMRAAGYDRRGRNLIPIKDLEKFL
jgi:hypothetical protein